MPEVTLSEKVAAVLHADDSGEGFVGQCHKSSGLGGPWTEYELDLLDWGAVYGAAFGIARTEDPFESVESCAARASEAARVAWLDYAGRELRRPEAVPA